MPHAGRAEQVLVQVGKFLETAACSLDRVERLNAEAERKWRAARAGWRNKRVQSLIQRLASRAQGRCY